MFIIGHRGSAGTHPENTLKAIDVALDCGVDWIEIDVRMVDDTIIVLHDDTLDRTTNGYGSIYAHSLEELRKLDAGDGQQIPLLAEALDKIDGQVTLNIEIKEPQLTESLVAFTARYVGQQPRWQNRILLSSFYPQTMRELSRLAPAGHLLAALSETNADESIKFALDIGAYSVNIALAQLSKSVVDEAHRDGLKVLVYTVNEVTDIERCYDCSVDGVFSDFPARAIAFLRNSPMISATIESNE